MVPATPLALSKPGFGPYNYGIKFLGLLFPGVAREAIPQALVFGRRSVVFPSSFSRHVLLPQSVRPSSARSIPSPLPGGGRNDLAVPVDIEVAAVGLFDLGDRVRKTASCSFEGSLDFSERSTSLEEQSRDKKAGLGEGK